MGKIEFQDGHDSIRLPPGISCIFDTESLLAWCDVSQIACLALPPYPSNQLYILRTKRKTGETFKQKKLVSQQWTNVNIVYIR
ncbi:hypothetical protein CEXT_236231 [Caerostris extrusa]|uniref:Uncharacterized protein n=1 Tax=Caerostris extrusa TaxID=172846 RepID=A0AAV4SGX9_CAEEX|nr:hypothetical protein CEXT_236231 [Caerostris extrusa]